MDLHILAISCFISSPHIKQHRKDCLHYLHVYMSETKTVHSQFYKMMRLCWFILLLSLFANAKDNTAVYKESGESITLECSSAGCPSSIEGYTGMYLYHEFKELDEVLYFHSKPGTADKITPRPRYKNRTQTEGPLKNHTITISNLTVDDTGLYRCAFIKFPGDKVRCNVYTLIVGGGLNESGVVCKLCDVLQHPASGMPCASTSKKSQPLVLIIIATIASSTLVTVIFILLILPRVKQWTSNRRRRERVPRVSNDYVYEVMTKNGFCSLAAPERSPPSPCDLA
ncbi:uncharacterized protein LOC127354356 [Dicentrarchus labrax]|uniref:uncharacterized protein LOC127354356 n=1 Tax=Dicentrarchus labrax TaxID=13489 RepID=UPI0021F548AA|nr:uncharacterized protein LOC127354356 [Dicentrarchus labrax]